MAIMAIPPPSLKKPGIHPTPYGDIKSFQVSRWLLRQMFGLIGAGIAEAGHENVKISMAAMSCHVKKFKKYTKIGCFFREWVPEVREHLQGLLPSNCLSPIPRKRLYLGLWLFFLGSIQHPSILVFFFK